MSTNQVRVIESPANPQFKLWKKCLEPSGIKKHGKFLLAGRKLVEEFIETHPQLIEAMLSTAKLTEKFREVRSLAPLYEMSNNLFSELDVVGTDFPLLLMKAPEFKPWEVKNPKGLEVFLALQDPGNLGAALRLCEAFDVQKVVCLRECAHPLHPKSIKGSAGSVLRLPLFLGPSITELQVDKTWLALDADGTSLSQFEWPKNCRLLLGEEGRGLPAELKSTVQLISVPMKKSLESLNATSALAITLYDQNSKL